MTIRPARPVAMHKSQTYCSCAPAFCETYLKAHAGGRGPGDED